MSAGPDTTTTSLEQMIDIVVEAVWETIHDQRIDDIREEARKAALAVMDGAAILMPGEVPPWMEPSHWSFEGEQGRGPAESGETQLYRLVPTDGDENRHE